MTIRVIMAQTLVEPDHGFDAKRVFEMLLRDSLRPARVAIGIEQALPRRQHAPGAVEINRAPLQDKIMRAPFDPLSAGNTARRHRIARHHIFPAPAIEAKVERQTALAMLSNQRAGVAQPDVASWHCVQRDPPGGDFRLEREPGAAIGFSRPASDPDGRDDTQRLGKGCDFFPRGFKRSAPLAAQMRPADPDRRLRRPFRW